LILRATFYEQLNEALSKLGPTLLKEDFSTSVDPPPKNVASATYDFELRVAYNYDPDYYFRYTFTVQRDGMYTGHIKMSPGQHILVDEFDASMKVDVLIQHINNWGLALQSELLALPVKRLFQEQQHLIDSIFDQFGDLPDEYFTRAEAENLRAKLDDLESRLSAHISASSLADAEKEEKLARLHREIEELKKQTEVLKKPGFVRRFFSRLSNSVDEETKQKLIGESAEMLGKFAKGLIGSGNGDGPSE